MAERLTRERIVDAAAAIVEADGLEALSMRTLCDNLGVSVTSIYWHVGNKDALLDALIERARSTIVDRQPQGTTPRQRLASIAMAMLASIEAHGELIGVAHQRGAVAEVFAPARRAIAVELHAAGMRGDSLVDATNAVIQYVVGFSLTQSISGRSTDQRQPVDMWEGDPPVDAAAASGLNAPPDLPRAFRCGLDALLVGLLAL